MLEEIPAIENQTFHAFHDIPQLLTLTWRVHRGTVGPKVQELEGQSKKAAQELSCAKHCSALSGACSQTQT